MYFIYIYKKNSIITYTNTRGVKMEKEERKNFLISDKRREFLKYLGFSSLLYVLGVPLGSYTARAGTESKGMKIVNEVIDVREMIGKGGLRFSISKVRTTVTNRENMLQELESIIILPLTAENQFSQLPEDVAVIVRNYTINKTYIVLTYNTDISVKEAPLNAEPSEIIKSIIMDDNVSTYIKRFANVLLSMGVV